MHSRAKGIKEKQFQWSRAICIYHDFPKEMKNSHRGKALPWYEDRYSPRKYISNIYFSFHLFLVEMILYWNSLEHISSVVAYTTSIFFPNLGMFYATHMSLQVPIIHKLWKRHSKFFFFQKNWFVVFKNYIFHREFFCPI